MDAVAMVNSWWSKLMSVRWKKVVQNGSILEVPWTRLVDALDVGDEGKGEIRQDTPRCLA